MAKNKIINLYIVCINYAGDGSRKHVYFGGSQAKCVNYGGNPGKGIQPKLFTEVEGQNL